MLTDADIQKLYKANRVCFNEEINRQHFARAIESEVRKEQADKIAELEAEVTRFKDAAICERDARQLLEKQLSEARKPTQFWDNDDAETCYHSIDELLNSDWCDGSIEEGAVFTIQQSHRLPNIMIEVTSISEDGDVEYREIDEAIKAKEQP